MKEITKVAGLMSWMFICSTLLFAETEKGLLVKRWSIVSHQKAGKSISITKDDFIQLSGDGIYQHSKNNAYTKGTWALNSDELTMNYNGEYTWKVVSVTITSMSLSRGIDEMMELKAIDMPTSVEKTASAHTRYLCLGKWRPNEHHKGVTVIRFKPTDMISFFPNGTFERISNSTFSKGIWEFTNEEETALKINDEVWKIENITALFFKMSKASDGSEFILFAKTR